MHEFTDSGSGGGPLMLDVAQEQLTAWAESCLRINHLNTLVQRELSGGSSARAAELSERARHRAWVLFNELLAAGASEPPGYASPEDPE